MTDFSYSGGNDHLQCNDIEEIPVFFRHPHPKIYKKIEKTTDLIKKGVKPVEFENKGGLSRENYQNFFNIIYHRHLTLNKFLKVNKQYGIPANKSVFEDENKELKGIWNALVLLVDFPDKKNITSVKHYDDLLFGEGMVETGSMRDYYREVSGNHLDLQGDVGGWYQTTKNYSDYVDLGQVNKDTLKWKMPRAKALVKETLQQAKGDNSLNFSKYDNDGNGKIDILIVVYAGEGAERTSNFSQIYPHRGTFSQPVVLKDGIVADNYILMHELPSHDLGGYCHEVAHSLGVPDLYLPDFSSTMVGRWCLMGVGCYNNDGKTPGHLSAWCKSHVGWTKPEIIKGPPQTYHIPGGTDTGKRIFKLEIKGSHGKEYFLVENRQKKGFDEYLPSHGLLIWHVDENKLGNYFPNTDYKHPFLSLEQADGKNELGERVIEFSSLGPNLTKKDLTGDEGDVYPGDTNNRSFNAQSKPNSKSSKGYQSLVSITDITDSGEGISAKMGYNPQGQIIIPFPLWHIFKYLKPNTNKM